TAATSSPARRRRCSTTSRPTWHSGSTCRCRRSRRRSCRSFSGSVGESVACTRQQTTVGMEAWNLQDWSLDSSSRLAAFGTQLIEVHDWLRAELARLRSGIGTRDLRAHCLTFCSAVTRHHTGEDSGAFVTLAADFPALRPVLAELVRDHEQVAEMLRV